jgi:carboxypeptidase Q
MRTKTSVLIFSLIASTALCEEPIDWDMINRIRDEGLRHSHVMEIAQALTEDIGPRLTGSPQMKRANEWTRDKLSEWGLEASLEPFEHGRGWSFDRATVQMLEPLRSPLLALPKAWTPGTHGAVRGQAMRATIDSEDDFETYRGKIRGKILFFDAAREVAEGTEPAFRRYGGDELGEISHYEFERERRSPAFRERYMKAYRLRRPLAEFLVAEGALAVVERSARDDGLVLVTGNRSYEVGDNPGVTTLVMAAEHYNRVLRLLDEGKTVELEIDVAARFHDEDTNAYNTVAAFQGTDLSDQIVMLGAHLDSWHAASGATDNAAGSAVVLEVIRILKAVSAEPRRTIRVALWSGEEQGLHGSRAYVAEHFASRPEDPEQKNLPSFMRDEKGPLTLKPEHARLAAYFNIDNGSGRIRGIYAQGNVAVMPIFEAWLRPFADLGATTVSPRNTGGTDHLSFDAVGLPGFQFIQDPLDYSTRTHHTNVDVYDHLRREDLMQASVIMASFVYHAAMRDEKLPRKPLPRDEARAMTHASGHP